MSNLLGDKEPDYDKAKIKRDREELHERNQKYLDECMRRDKAAKEAQAKEDAEAAAAKKEKNEREQTERDKRHIAEISAYRVRKSVERLQRKLDNI